MKLLRFDCVAVHTKLVFPDRPTTWFSVAERGNSGFATSLGEHEVVSWLFRTPGVRERILWSIGLGEDSRATLRVGEPFIRDPHIKPGDIDALLYYRSRPHEAVAVEFKRAKVKVESFQTGSVTKVNSVGNGVRQANALAALGFHKTYLAVLVVVDGRERPQPNVFFRGTTDKQLKQLYEFPSRAELKPEVGILFVEVVQPTELSLDDLCFVAVAVDRKPQPRRQPDEITNKVVLLAAR